MSLRTRIFLELLESSSLQFQIVGKKYKAWKYQYMKIFVIYFQLLRYYPQHIEKVFLPDPLFNLQIYCMYAVETSQATKYLHKSK